MKRLLNIRLGRAQSSVILLITLLICASFYIAFYYAPPPADDAELSVPRSNPSSRFEAMAQAQGSPLQGLIAPEFPRGTKWLNSERPVSLRGLRGKIVLLDFWTYGCINCMHMISTLRELERKYPNELVVLGVHRAKFNNEQKPAHIQNAMLRYNIKHAVAVDHGKIWEDYQAKAWPTLVLIDPDGRVIGSMAGEVPYAILDNTVRQLTQRTRSAGTLKVTATRLAAQTTKVPTTDLSYPGKVLVDTATNHLFIADSNHNRVIIAKLNGKVEAVAGSGVAGLRDGAFDIANFQNPQGMALWHDEDESTVLLVADTGNHAIRALDLTRGKVTTLAGTGVSDPWRGSGLRADARLSSPWDLQVVGSTLYIAVAGSHQIWAMDLPSRQVSLYAGSSREAREDGSLTHASFAQPSGLATDGKRLFVADSETSTVRAVDLPGHGSQVRTLAGGDLFQFGDRDGVGDAARLQHPLGIAYRDGVIYITDTYNHKIKMLNPTTGRVHVLLGNGAGVLDGSKPQFYEPGGLSIGGDKIYVADTNNHKIRIIDLNSKSVSTLSLQNLPLPLPAEPGLATAPSRRDTIIVLPPVRLRPNTRGEILLDIKLPPGHELNRESPQHFGAHAEGKGLTITSSAVEAGVLNLPLRIPIATGPVGGHGVITAAATIFYCSHERGICKMKSFNFRVPFTVADRGARSLTLQAELE